MIIKEEYRFREGDNPKKKPKFRRKHILIVCDKCTIQEWKIYHSFIKSKGYSSNNQYHMDFCRNCSLKLLRKPRQKQNITNELPSKKKRIRTRTSHGYLRKWITDLNHPRINKNKRDKNPIGGRVYEHILVMEQEVGRYLHPEERVHHIDGDKTNNNIENLYLCKNDQHHKEIHSKLYRFAFSLIKEGLIYFDTTRETFHIDTF